MQTVSGFPILAAVMLMTLTSLAACPGAQAPLGGAAQTPGGDPEVVGKAGRPDVVEKAIETAKHTLKEKLAKGFPADKIETREEVGPFGTIVVVAAAHGAYPGSGVLRLPIDTVTGVGYGRHGARTFADFAREHDWLEKAPATAELVRFVNLALFENVAMIDREPAPQVRRDTTGLVIEFVRRFMPSHSGEWIVVTVPTQGAEDVERRPLKEGE